jgi:hypothetical protein
MDAKTVRDAGLDKFYTRPEIANQCIELVKNKYNIQADLVIEPSAGNGSFYNNLSMDNKIGLDIAPEHNNILKKNFFDFTLTDDKIVNKNILIIGNPPFGKVSSLAIKFFNYAANLIKLSNIAVIAFIIPKTFRRVSVQNKLNPYFHLVLDNDIPDKPCSFTPIMNVKCCFQIWEKRTMLRSIIELETTHKDWDFLPLGPLDAKNQPTPPKNANFAIRAYGGKCGEIVQKNLHTLRPKSWHWIKCKKELPKKIMIQRFNSLDYYISKNTARQNSIGRGELVQLYKDKYNIPFE